MIVVAITGASGVIYGVRLLEVLKKLNKDTALVITDPARIILRHELNMEEEELKELTGTIYDPKDLTASINSGSFRLH